MTDSVRIPGKVLWKGSDRKATDVACGVIFVGVVTTSFCLLLLIITSAGPSFVTDPEKWAEWASEESQKCYEEIGEPDQAEDYGRRLDDHEVCSSYSLFGAIGFDSGPVVTIFGAIVVVAVGWLLCLQKAARGMVLLTEAFKIFALLYLYAGMPEQNPMFLVFAAVYTALICWKRARLEFAAKIISHAAKALNANKQVIYALVILKAVYVLQTAFFIYALTFTPNLNRPDPKNFCIWGAPSWLGTAIEVIGFNWLWSIVFYSQVRLSVITLIVGSWHWHPESKPTVGEALRTVFTKSLGTNAAAALLVAIIKRLKAAAKFRWYMIFSPAHLLFWIVCWCVYTCIKMLSKFALIISMITGEPFFKSARHTFDLMTRHFENGMVTEATSQSVMTLSAVVVSYLAAFSVWGWYDTIFEVETFGHSDIPFEIYIFLLMPVFHYPAFFLILLVVLEVFLSAASSSMMAEDALNGCEEAIYPTELVPMLCGVFCGCISMIFFRYVGDAVMDTISVCFVTFAVDKDNGVDMSSNEFAQEIVKEVPGVITQLSDPAGGKIEMQAMQPPMQPMVMMQPMQPIVGADGQPVMMQPMQPIVGADGQPVMMQPMVGQPVPMVGQPVAMAPTVQ